MTDTSAPYLLALCRFAAATPLAEIPPEVIARGRRILADCAACMAGGAAAPEMRALAGRFPAASGEASWLGSRLRFDRDRAAFLGGASGTWDDLDEGNIHTKGHPGIQILPALLAEAEATQARGADVLRALILAYEVSARLYRACRARLAIHPHGTFGPLAAALAVGLLRRLDGDALARLVNIAATLGIAASRQTLAEGATVRNAYTGHSGRAAFLAHELRDSGFTGERDAVGSVFGGIYGEAYDPALAVEALGETWWIMRCYFKRHASARYVHSALDLAEQLLVRHGGRIDPDAVAAIEIDTYFMAATMAGQATSAFGTRFSIPHAVAALLVQGKGGPDNYGAAALADPVIQALAALVVVREDEGLTTAYPATQPTRLSIRWDGGDGDLLAATYIRGESEHPFTDAELDAKFDDLAGRVWRDPAAARARLLGIADEPDMAILMADLAALATEKPS